MTDHDRLFKELLTTFFAEFIELFLPAVTQYLDPTSLVALDKEVFTDVTSGEKHEADIVVRANFKGTATYFLLHVEHQSSDDSRIGRRMFNYFSRLYEKYAYPVYPIVLFSFNKPLRAEPTSFQIAFPDKMVLDFSYSVIQLNRLNWRDYLNQPNPIASALMAKMQFKPEDRPRVKLECLRMLIGLKLDPARTRLISGFVGSYLQLNDQEEAEFKTQLESISPTEKEKAMEIVTDWTLRGRAEGRAEGQQSEALSLALRLVRRKFGSANAQVEQQINKLGLNELEELSEALFDFSEPAELQSWLQQHPTD